MLTSYHNHSHWSDGRASVTSMLHEAQRVGLDELGISDHLVYDPHGNTPGWSMEPARLPAYLMALDQARAQPGPRLRVGLEIDWIPGQQGVIEAALGDDRLDFAIGSVHQVNGLHVDTASDELRWLPPSALEQMYTRYWSLVRDMAASGLFQIAGHIDLPKKLLRDSTVHLASNVDEALDAIAEAGMVVELNTAGWLMPCAECYPSPTLLRACHARGIPVTVSADAHSSQHLLRDFERAVRLLREIGYSQLARFEGRQPVMQPLDDFEARLLLG